jgi:hypothetical protein
MYRAVILFIALGGAVLGHDMTPTYPKWKMSYIPTADMTTMKIFNKRADVNWYQINVFDKDFKPLPFVTRYKILQVGYLKHKNFDVYISQNNVDDAEYICTTSKLRGNDDFKPIVESRICSRFK